MKLALPERLRPRAATSVRIADPRVDPEPEGWAQFVERQRGYAVWDYDLMRLEAWMSSNPPILVVDYQDGEIVLAMTVMMCTPRTKRYADLPPYRPWARITPRWAEVCLPWISGLPGFLHDPELSADTIRASTRRCERALANHFGPGLLGVFYRAVNDDLLPALDGTGRLVKQTDSVAVLRLDFADVDGWLAGLTRNRRKSLRKLERLLARDTDLVVRGGPGRTDLDPVEVTRLVNSHRLERGVARFDMRLLPTATYMDAFLRHRNVHTLTFHDTAGRLLGVNTLIDHPVRPVLQHWASAPLAEGGKPNLYFDAYIRVVRHLTAVGRPELSAGRGLLDVKETLGFEPNAVYGVVATRPVLGR